MALLVCGLRMSKRLMCWQRGMLAQLAARLRARQAGGGEGEDEGGPVVVDDNCLVGTIDLCWMLLRTNPSCSLCEKARWIIR